MLNIHEFMAGLAEKRPIFHREEDFQFALAWHIKEIDPSAEIRLEFFNPFLNEQQRRYMDIFVKSEGIVIELKYPTKSIKVKHHGEMFAPGLKGAGKKGRYGCVEDIFRIEQALLKHPDVQFGIFVLLANRDDFLGGAKAVKTL